MRRTKASPQVGRHANLAWLLGILASIGFLLVLAVSPRQVEGAPLDGKPASFVASASASEESESEEEEAPEDTEGPEAIVEIEEFDEEGFEGEEEGLEEGEEPEETAGGKGRDEGCRVRTGTARATARRDTLKLTIGYSASLPVDATIEVRRGDLRIAGDRFHLGRGGVLRLSEKLGGSKQLQAGDRISVGLDVVGAESGCEQVGRIAPRTVLPVRR